MGARQRPSICIERSSFYLVTGVISRNTLEDAFDRHVELAPVTVVSRHDEM
jgi:hypothetical protein